jgi:ATP-dependent Clp protease ATP-binding subunit ClpA
MKSENTEAAGKASLDPLVVRGLTPSTKRVFSRALGIANECGHAYVGSDHLLLGLLATPGTVATTLLEEIGLNPARLSVLAREAWDKAVPHNISSTGQEPA